jgi:hypothetical protein
MTNHHESNNLRKQLASHYLEQNLSPEQLTKLQQLSPAKNRFFMYFSVAIAASFFTAISWYLINLNQYNPGPISAQIAYNHNSQMQMEVLSPDLKDVQGHLTKLGFQLISSSKINRQHWQLIGGRYCNINGKIAAQLKIKNTESNQIYTYYQAKLPGKQLATLSQTEIAIDGVNVKLWREKGLLMGLAF